MDVTLYWNDPPPTPTDKCVMWQAKIDGGWRPNKRIRSFGYQEAAEFYGIYIWEYFNVIAPLLREVR